MSGRPAPAALSRHAAAGALALLAAWLFQLQFAFGLNASPSLPYRLFLIHKGERVPRGGYVAFCWHGGGPYAPGTAFVKILAGLPGDTVQRHGRQVFLNGRYLATAKARARDGSVLEPGPEGTIGPGRFHVHAPHPDSLDSRYALTGWIRSDQITGRAYAIF